MRRGCRWSSKCRQRGSSCEQTRVITLQLQLLLCACSSLFCQEDSLGTAGRRCCLLLQTWTQTTTYLQLVGILLGQLFFGVMGDAVGRRAAMLTDMVRYRLQQRGWIPRACGGCHS